MSDPTPTLRELFEAALALAPEERGAFLAERCLDTGQRAAVERLLAADAQGGARVLDDSFDALLDRVGDTADAASPATNAGGRDDIFVA